MTTAVHFFLPVSDSISNHLSLSSALDEPSQRVMQPYSPVSPSDSTLTVLNPPSSHFTPGERYQDTPLRPIPSFSSSLPSLPRRTLPPPSKLNHHQHFVSQTHRPISPIGTPQTPLAGLGRTTYGYPRAAADISETSAKSVYTLDGNKGSRSDASTAVGRTNTNAFSMDQPALIQKFGLTTSRCRLHIRQQPRAARAGPDGKDRRAIDPPPILQLHMEDFDPDSKQDVAELSSPFWVVHCKLVAAQTPDRDVSTMAQTTEDGRKEVQRLLLGTTVASPTNTVDDPDPPTLMPHPRSEAAIAAPPSPTSRFLPVSSSRPLEQPIPLERIPGTFFIFADVSVRKAGEYRLQFVLMKMDLVHLAQGAVIPAIDTVTTDVFKVVNAKDFDQVQPSTNLVKGLLDRGAGFPLKLKKGLREGQRRRRHNSRGDSEDDSDDGDLL